MRRATIVLACSAVALASASAQPRRAATPAAYVPLAGSWESRPAAQLGLDQARLDSAVAFAIANETKAPRDQFESNSIGFSREPYGEPLGPFATRGPMSGVVIRHGYVAATWGDPTAVEMTHSVTKSLLSSVVGLAVAKGLIRSVNDTVRPYIGPVYALNAAPAPGSGTGGAFLDLFSSPHNRTITWNHLLQQNSDWEGTLWDKPDWADRPEGAADTWRTRARNAPGTVYKYNDVRVNALALAALMVWRRPLPDVAKELIMDPIGASPTWRWYGYRNSWVLLDGKAVQSVSGGGHWGGGLYISAWDMARFGLLSLRKGKWGDREVLPASWVEYATTPSKPNAGYGIMNWFLNVDGKLLPSAPRTAFVHLGNGTNAIVVDPEHDLVIVVRWISNNQLDGVVKRVIAAVTP
ncbi:MAG: serine hydrolase [Gemmatimonadetes bacterium]|nr:serine hydrolase [Gemmatimonadota bacterium]